MISEPITKALTILKSWLVFIGCELLFFTSVSMENDFAEEKKNAVW